MTTTYRRKSPSRSSAGAPQENARAEQALAAVVGMFERDELPQAIAQTLIRRQESDAPSAEWSLGNQILMLLAGTADARGYRQWNTVGRHVTKGSRAVTILAPMKRTRTDRNPETGLEEKRTYISGFRGIPVFRYEDTEGQPLEVADYTPATFPPLFDAAARLGIPVKYLGAARQQGFRGYYSPDSNEIVLFTYDVRTFFHELAHAAHATFRELKGGQNPAQEIVAETVAATLCHLYGIDGYLSHSADYIRAYDREHGNPGRAAMKVLADVQKCLDVILSAAPAGAADELELRPLTVTANNAGALGALA